MKNNILPVIIIALIGLLVLSLGFFVSDEYMWMLFAVIALAVVITIFIFDLKFGLYILAFLYPFMYWQVVYGSWNVPYGDLLALIIFVAWVMKRLYLRMARGERLRKDEFPLLLPMILFIASAALSLINIPYEDFNAGVKYIFRPMIFFYLMFIILPYNIIDSKKVLLRVLKVLFWLGMFVSAMGFWSLLFPEIKGLRRAVPISVFGTYPLGVNHNLLAEVLITLIPIAFIFFAREKDQFKKTLYLLSGLFMIGINLLTLSRAGWIAIIVEGIVFAYIFRKQAKKILSGYGLAIIIAALLPFIIVMYKLVTSYTSIAATSTRLKLIDIGIAMFNEAPLIGKGVNTFIPTVFNTFWFIIEYGTTLDAHGFIFKVLPEQGIIGLATFLFLLVSAFWMLFKRYVKAQKTDPNWAFVVIVLSVAALGGIVFQITGTSYYIGKMWLPIGIALAASKFLMNNRKREDLKRLPTSDN